MPRVSALLMAGLVLFLYGCAKPVASPGNYERVQDGMTRKQVTALLGPGEPVRDLVTSFDADLSSALWLRWKDPSQAPPLYYYAAFVDGKVARKETVHADIPAGVQLPGPVTLTPVVEPPPFTLAAGRPILGRGQTLTVPGHSRADVENGKMVLTTAFALFTPAGRKAWTHRIRAAGGGPIRIRLNALRMPGVGPIHLLRGAITYPKQQTLRGRDAVWLTQDAEILDRKGRRVAATAENGPGGR